MTSACGRRPGDRWRPTDSVARHLVPGTGPSRRRAAGYGAATRGRARPTSWRRWPAATTSRRHRRAASWCARSSPPSTTGTPGRPSTLRICASTCFSHRLVKPHGQNLKGMSACWPTSPGPRWARWAVDQVETVRLNSPHPEGLALMVTGIDKFPRMTDYVGGPPECGSRTSQNRVRLGAHLWRPAPPSCTRAPTNFNAGTLGTSIVEGQDPQRGCGHRRRLRHRRRRLHHGHPVRRRQADHLDQGRALPARRRGGTWVPRSWATSASSRPVCTSPRAPRRRRSTAPRSGSLSSGCAMFRFAAIRSTGAVEVVSRGRPRHRPQSRAARQLISRRL